MPNNDYKVVIRADKRPAGTHEWTFNAPTIDKVAILIVGENLGTRDIVLTRRDTGQLQKIYETHRSYDADVLARRCWISLQYQDDKSIEWCVSISVEQILIVRTVKV